MNKEDLKRIEDMLKGSKSVIVAADGNTAVIGEEVLVLSNFSAIVQNLRQCTEDEKIRHAFELAFKSEEELENDAKKAIENIFSDPDKLKAFGEFLSNVLK